jgi:Cellulose biosynthesis protein BcsS
MRVASLAAIFLAGLVQYCAVDPAAADMLEHAPHAPTVLYFSGVDLWHEGGFLHGGFLWSPRGLDQEGLTLKLIFGSGIYRYRSGALGDVEVTGRQWLGSLMPGWRFKRRHLELTVFAGPDAQHHRLSPDDPENGIRGGHVGLRSGFDLWSEPTAATMLAVNGSISTISTSYDARAAYGWRLFQEIYAGPEAQALASDSYRQYRFGLHVTAFKWREFEMSAGTGYARDSSHRCGIYGRLSVITRR